jgi:beta-phosphoglucomutase
MNIRAVIFDMNGTVLADEDEYGTAFREVLGKLGKRVDESFPHTRGIGVNENWPLLIAKYKIKTKKTSDELASMTQDAYLKRINKVHLKNGFLKFADKLKGNGTLIALATSNSWLMVESIFDELNIDKYFDVTTTSEEVSFNKPSPEIFAKTAEKLGVEPKECLVIEDSQAGIEAALAAGMKVVGVAHDKKHGKTLKEANMIVGDFVQLSLRFDELLNT